MGTHPIFESDFDCLTEHSNGLERGNRNTKRKWANGAASLTKCSAPCVAHQACRRVTSWAADRRVRIRCLLFAQRRLTPPRSPPTMTRSLARQKITMSHHAIPVTMRIVVDLSAMFTCVNYRSRSPNQAVFAVPRNQRRRLVLT